MFAAAFGLLATASAIPVEERDDVQIVHLNFHGGPANYTLAIPADGSVHETSEQPPRWKPCISWPDELTHACRQRSLD